MNAPLSLRLRLAASCLAALALLSAEAPSAAAESHLSLWSRTPGGATVAGPDSSGSYQVVATKAGDASDWSLSNDAQTPVQPNTLLTLSAWVKCQDGLPARLDVIERDAGGNVLNWQYAPVTVSGTRDWARVVTRFVPEAGAATLQARLEGDGKGTYWIKELGLTSAPLPITPGAAGMHYDLNNGKLDVQISAATGAITVTPVGGGAVWSQPMTESSGMIGLGGELVGRLAARVRLLNAANGQEYVYGVRLDPAAAKIMVTLDAADGAETGASLPAPIDFPPPFMPHVGDALVVPNNEGLLYPAEDQTVAPYDMPLYGGHSGLSMPWYGIAMRGGRGAGMMAVVSTPDDATLSLRRRASREPDGGPAGMLLEQLVWEAQKGQFGYARHLTYIFLPGGGYVAQAKTYRRIAKAEGLLVTLAQKRKINPNVDKLVGAADVWDFEGAADALTVAQGLKASGKGARILWSQRETPDAVRALNALGFLTGEYDIYQDVYEPSAPHAADAPEWHPQADHWPEDLVLDASGKPVVSWVDYQINPDGTKTPYTADACCSIPGLTRAEHKIPDDLKDHPYGARFIDTLTASPWRECYNPLHPTTRTQDKAAKMAMLRYVAGTEHLVCGSETGIDCAVPYEDYFEGMTSLARYRQPNSGYNLTQETPPTPDFLKYQVGTRYRIPLFELVYHDCMVTTWYWGDSSNVEHDYWTTRDLFNILYGTSPLFILDKTRWQTQHARFAQTLTTVGPVIRKLGYATMLSHRFVTPDGSVQETRWSDGTTVRVDFARGDYTLSGE